MSLPYMPFYIGDYLKDTTHLSAAEHGAYVMLIFAYWQKGELPTDEGKLRRISRMTEQEWNESRDTLAEFFADDWRHPRIEEVMLEATTKHLKLSAAGSAGGKKSAETRRQKTEASTQASSDASTIGTSGASTQASSDGATHAGSEASSNQNQNHTQKDSPSQDLANAKSIEGAAKIPDQKSPVPTDPADLSEEDRFWTMATDAEKVGINRGQLGRLAKAVGADALTFSQAIKTVQGAMRAKGPVPYLAKAIERIETDAGLKPEPKSRGKGAKGLPAFVQEWRAGGEVVEPDGLGRWRCGGRTFDDSGGLIGW